MILTFYPAVVFALADAGIMVPAMYASTDGRPVIIRVATLTIVRFSCFIIGGATLCAMKPHGTAGIAFMILRNQPLRLTGQCRLTHGRNAGMGAFDFANRAAYLVALSAAPCAVVTFRMAAGKAADAARAVCTRAAPRAAPIRFRMVAGKVAQVAFAGRIKFLPCPCTSAVISMFARNVAYAAFSGIGVPNVRSLYFVRAGKAADAALAVCTRAAPRAAPVRFLMVAGQLADAALAGQSVILPFPCAIFAIFMVAALTASLTLSGGVIPLL